MASGRSSLALGGRKRMEIRQDYLSSGRDPLRLRQLVTILVDNAVRFSPEGGEVEVQALPGDALATDGEYEVIALSGGFPMPTAGSVEFALTLPVTRARLVTAKAAAALVRAGLVAVPSPLVSPAATSPWTNSGRTGGVGLAIGREVGLPVAPIVSLVSHRGPTMSQRDSGPGRRTTGSMRWKAP